MLEFRNVEARYGGFVALRDVSFAVQPGERVAIFGHNGAGKTTLLRCGLGDVDEVSGSITYNGEVIVAGSVYRNARRGIGFVPQGHNVFRDLSVAQNLKIAGLLHDQAYLSEGVPAVSVADGTTHADRQFPSRVASSRCLRSAWP